jgi:hypothetical protein
MMMMMIIIIIMSPTYAQFIFRVPENTILRLLKQLCLSVNTLNTTDFNIPEC